MASTVTPGSDTRVQAKPEDPGALKRLRGPLSMILKDFPEGVWKTFMIMELRPVEQRDSHDHGRALATSIRDHGIYPGSGSVTGVWGIQGPGSGRVLTTMAQLAARSASTVMP